MKFSQNNPHDGRNEDNFILQTEACHRNLFIESLAMK